MSSLIHRNNNSHRFPLLHSKRPPPTTRSSSPHPFEEILAVHLRSLLPIPVSRPSLPWLSRFAQLLASTIAAAGALFADDSEDDEDAVAAHLDAGVNLLDACNAVSAEIARLRSALLPLLLALRLLSSSSSDDAGEEGDEGASKRRRPRLDSRVRRARAAIEEWEALTRHDIRRSAGDFVRRLTPVAPPRAVASSVRKAAYAVEAVSKLVMEAVVAALAGGGGNRIETIEVPREWPWAEAFDEVQAAASGRLGEEFAGEAAVRNLRAAMDVASEEDEAAEELGSALSEAERAAAELTEGLDRLGDGVNAVFNAAIKTRDVALNRLRHRLLWCH